jgi:hypothetical protein
MNKRDLGGFVFITLFVCFVLYFYYFVFYYYIFFFLVAGNYCINAPSTNIRNRCVNIATGCSVI